MSLYDATVASTNVVYAQLFACRRPRQDRRCRPPHGYRIGHPRRPFGGARFWRAVSPLEMASAYSSFATNGRWARPYLVSRIVDARGEGDPPRGGRSGPR